MPKKCVCCNFVKSEDDFDLSAMQKDGLQSYCKKCFRLYEKSLVGQQVNKRYKTSSKWKVVIKKYHRSAKGREALNRAQQKYRMKKKRQLKTLPCLEVV